MRVLRTGHIIADTVAAALELGFLGTIPHKFLSGTIGYGILRGNAKIFRECESKGEPYFNVDRGYFKPNHYDGFYRVSLNGTQQTIGLDKLEPDYDRLEALNLDIKEWRGFDWEKPVLVCAPTENVQNFFNINTSYPELWRQQAVTGEWLNGTTFHRFNSLKKVTVRIKGDSAPINFADYNYVKTFNSSVGWQALQAGIPCVSDTPHSIVGKWFENISLENLSEAQYVDRNKLFAVMADLQLSLEEIRAGKICNLVEKLLALKN